MSGILNVALTGGIGSGKSTVASEFQTFGIPIIDADVIARTITAPGKPCLTAIVNVFGNDLLSNEGVLDRRKLGHIIFNDVIAKKKLESILHPVIYQEIEHQISKVNYPYCLIVVPLLIETNATDKFDRILLVDIPEQVQLKRVVNRDKISPDTMANIIKSQAGRESRLKYADDIIDNTVAIADLKLSVRLLHEKYLTLTKKQ